MSSKKRAKEWPYKRHKQFIKELRISSQKWFLNNGFNVHPKMPYCLDKFDNWSNNLIVPEVVNYINGVREECEQKKIPFPLHKYIHHGLSSQAMVFNLIGPLVVNKDFKPLELLLEDKGVVCNISDAHFEYEDRDVFNEDSGQPTSIDLVLFNGANQPKIFIESKLVEAEFGGCSVFAKGDCTGQNPVNDLKDCYLHFIGRKYWELMEEYGFTKHLEEQKICVFVNYYQFFREVLFSLKFKGYFVLLYDERSPVFNFTANGKTKGLIPFLMDFVPETHRKKIILISIQEILECIKKENNNEDWITEFELKYGLKALEVI